MHDNTAGNGWWKLWGFGLGCVLVVGGPRVSAADAGPGPSAVIREMNLEECLDAAFQNNHRRPASALAVTIAEAQHRQALSAYWPQITGRLAYQRMDEPPNFLFPATTMGIPAQSITVPGGAAMVTIPANAFAPGFPPANVQLPVAYPGQTINTPAQAFAVPEQNVELMDVDSGVASLNATWLLWDGGMRAGLKQQSRAGIDAAKQEARRTDLEITDSVRRLYFGAVLARQLHQIGKDTLARMEATLGLTETMYKEGAGKVTKADYLDNRVMVETLRSAVAQLEQNEEVTQAALAYTVGLSWNTSVRPTDPELPYEPSAIDLQGVVASAYQFNPDWARLDAGIRAAEGAVRTARSGHYPKVAVTGELHGWWNDSNSGLSTEDNRTGWTAGLGVEIPLFDGLLTRGRVQETKARLDKIREESFLLKEGIGLQIRDLFLKLSAAQKAHQATLDAKTAAEENRDLNTRAYQNELVETEKVIRAQLMEALMSVQHLKTRYDHLALKSQLDLVVGREVLRKVAGGKP
ncbi:MAG: TolC family protein [Verrucomicrobiales bacterium]|nr:TolC family protein [Verrucomicrobiales bacterium]